MFQKEVLDLLFQVIQSWQVLVITIALVLYLCLVNFVARTYRRPRFVSKKKALPAVVTDNSNISDDEDPLV